MGGGSSKRRREYRGEETEMGFRIKDGRGEGGEERWREEKSCPFELKRLCWRGSIWLSAARRR